MSKQKKIVEELVQSHLQSEETLIGYFNAMTPISARWGFVVVPVILLAVLFDMTSIAAIVTALLVFLVQKNYVIAVTNQHVYVHQMNLLNMHVGTKSLPWETIVKLTYKKSLELQTADQYQIKTNPSKSSWFGGVAIDAATQEFLLNNQRQS